MTPDLGGAGFVFIEGNDADIVYNSVLINLNVIEVTFRLMLNQMSTIKFDEWNIGMHQSDHHVFSTGIKRRLISTNTLNRQFLNYKYCGSSLDK